MENATLRNFLLRITLSISAAALLSISTTAQRVTSELVSLYTFEEGSGSVVNDVSGVSPAEDLHISHPNAIDWIPGGGLRIQSSTIVASDGPGTKHYNLLHNSPEISLEMWVGQTDTHQNGPARMMTLSQDTGERNFTLGHENSDYVVRMRTTNTNDQGTPESDMDANIQSGLQHVVYTYNVNTGVEKWYLNGQLQDTDSRGGSLNNWDPSHVFALANEITMDRPWLGDIHLAAVYCQVLDADEVMQNFEAGVNGQELCATILNGSSPYPANDPFFQQVIEEDSYCCESWWDHICDDLYVDHATTGDLTETCSLDGFGYPGGRIFWLPNEFGTDFKASDSGLFFDKFDDGTARIYGQVERISDAHEKFQVSIWFNNFSDYDTWIAQGGEAKGTHLGDETTWVFYSQDLSKTSYLKGLQDLDGELLYILPQDDNDYGLQLGDGANDLNSNDNGMSMWFDYVGTTNGHGDLNATYQCDDAPEPPLETFTLDCEDALKVSIEGIGMEGDGCADLDINYEEGNLEYIILETVWKANNPPASVVFTADGTEYTATAQIVVEGNGTDQGNKRAYRVQVPAASNVGVCVPNGFNHKLLSLVAYTFRSGMDLISAGSGEFVGRHLFNDSYTMSLSVPAADAPRDIVVTMPISDMSNDGRFADFIVTAGDITRSFAVTGNTNGLSLNLVPFVLENVPGDVTEVSIDLISDPNREPNPSSFLAAGLAVADAQCNVPEEEKICEVVGFNGPGTRHFIFFNAFGTNYTSSEEGLSWIEYADGTAKITGQIFAISDPDKIFDVTLYFEGKSNYDEFIAQGGEAKLEDGATLADAQDWTFYTFDDDRPNVLTGRGENEGVYIFLRQMDGMPYGLQVGANGANGKNDEFGISTWFSYSGTHEGNGDLNANLLCPEPVCEVQCPADLELDCESATHPDFTGYPTLICADNAGCVREPGEFDFEFQGWGGSTDGWSFGPGWDVGTGCDPACGDIPNVFIDFTNFHTDYNTKLKSPMYDACCTDEVSLSFCMQQDLYGGEDVPGFLKVQYRVHGGNWQTLETFESEYGATINYDREYVLDGAAGNTFEVRFKAYGEGSNYFTMGGWGIDNVRVFGQTEGCSAGEEEVSVDWSFSDVSNGTCPEVITRTFTATYQGENVECIQTLTLIDDSAPIFNSVPDDVTYACADEVVASSASALDNCSEDVEVTSEDIVNGSGCVFTIDRVFTATDACGNTATYTQVITVNDEEAPVLNGVPEDVTVECDQIPDAPVVSATDNCTDDVNVQLTEDIHPLDCGFLVIRTWTAEDDCGNLVTAEQTLTVTDNAAPVFDAEASDATVECDDIPDAPVITATDNCDDQVEVIFEEQVNSIDECTYEIIRTWTTSDDCGNSNSTSQTLTVTDTAAPFIVEAPEDVTINCDEAEPSDAPVFTDNCDENLDVTMTSSITEQDCGFIIEKSWTATDDCGNSVTATQTITVVDTEGPVITFQTPDQTIECDEEIPAINVTFVDNCDEDLTVVVDNYTNPLDCGFEYVKWCSATDDCGNTTEALVTITVLDTEAPVALSTPQDVTIECDQPEPSDMPVFSDNCDPNFEVVAASSISQLDCGFVIEKSWTATDECGNSTTVNQTITVTDTTAPELTGVPADETVECTDIPAAAMVTATDNCDDNVEVFFTETVEMLDCGYLLIRTWSATDNCGNSVSDEQVITVTDTVAPEFAAEAADATVECDNIPAAPELTATDACDDNVEVAFAEEMNPVDECIYEIIRTWTATDDCGNVAVETQVLTVQDTTPPTADGEGVVMDIDCDEDVPESTLTFSDNCDNNLEVTVHTQLQPLDCTFQYIQVVSATDDCGNTTSVTNIYTVVDDEAPVLIGVPEDATIDCDDEVPNAIVAAQDNCDEDVEVSLTAETVYNDCGYEIVRTWSATDDCGNVVSQTQTLTVEDTTPPVFEECPAPYVVNCDNGSSDPAFAGEPVVSDNCSEFEVTFEDGVATDECPATFTRTWIATDACGNVSTCEQEITINDFEAPVIDCPADITIECTESTDPANTGVATATDDCSEPNISFEDSTMMGDCPYTIERTWTAVDPCGNSSSCVQVITIVDTVAPELSGEDAEVTIECDMSADLPEVTATDNCDEDVEIDLVTEVIDGDCPQEFTEVYTWTATDDCDNQSVRTFTVNYVDTTAPILIGVPADDTIDCDDDVPNAIVAAQDNCDDNVEVSLTAETVYNECGYEIVRTWSATDACGNTVSQTQTLTVEDTTPPVFEECPAPYVVNCDNGSSDPEFAGEPVVSDNCSEFEVTFEDGVATDECPATFTRTWTATDACGNASTCEQEITINDFEAPVIDCPADVTIECTESTDPANTGVATATDDCSEPNISFEDSAMMGDCPYTIERTWTALDPCGNNSTCVQVITIVDTEAPVLSGEDGEETIECDMAIDLPEVTATDNCDENVEIDLVTEVIDGDCPQEFTEVYTWIATDDCDNQSVRTFTVNYVDTTAPILIGVPADDTIDCDDDVPNAIVAAQDNCDPNVEVSLTAETVYNECGYEIVRTWSAADDCGNVVSQTQTLTVEDTTPPVFEECPAPYVVNCDNGSSDPAFAGEPVVSDNCSEFEVTFEDGVATDECPATFTRTWIATDACGNASTCEQEITINDFSEPIIDCPADITVECPESTGPENTGMATATDDCSVPVITYVDGPLMGDCPFTFERIFTATDACGNSSSSVQVITIVDTVAPELSGEDTEVTIECDATPELPEVTATDACDDDVEIDLTTEVIDGDCPQEFTEVYTWIATDDCDNQSVRTFTVNYVDTTAPILIGVPADDTIDCDDDVPNAIVAAQDNCDDNVEVSLTAETVYNECGYEIVRTWSATDACGNTVSQTQTLTVEDTTPPVFEECPAPYVVDCDNGSSDPAFAGEPVVSDNCSEFEVTFEDGVATDECPATFTRTWIATDACGNVSTCEQEITINDFGDPIIDCPADITVECPESTDPENTGMATATDDCSVPVITYVDGPLMGDCPFTFERIFTATDACGNSSSSVQVITIVDTVAPELSGEDAEVTIECDATPQLPEVTATDACDDDVEVELTFVVIEGECPQAFTQVYTWIATDDCGNQSVRNFTVNYVDTTAPILIGIPEDVTAECDNVPAPAQVTAEDNCGDVELNFAEAINELDCGYELIRTWTAIDECGNQNVATQTVTVVDTTDPEVNSAPQDITLECDQPEPVDAPVFADNCDDDLEILAISGITNVNECGFTIERAWTAIDDCGNSTTVTQVITFIDTTAPVISGVPADVTVVCTDLPAAPEVTAVDNCDDNPSVELTETIGGGCPYTITRTWVSTDACGNQSSATQVITVIDEEAPILVGVPDDFVGECGNAPAADQVTAIDNCDEDIPVILTEEVLGEVCPLTIVRTWTATDNCGNTVSASQTITINDTTAPVFVSGPEDATVECDMVPGPDNDAIEVEDNCDLNLEITFEETSTPGEPAVEGGEPCGEVITRVWTATDDCGNSSSFTQTITVVDTTAPVLVNVPEDTIVECTAIPQPAVVTAVDNCFDGVMNVSLEESIVPAECGFQIVRTWTAADNCLNVGSATQVITVVDTEAPIVLTTPEDVTVECDEDLPNLMPSFDDACDEDLNITMTETEQPQNCGFLVIRTWTATDDCGNSVSTSQSIFVTDTTPPVFDAEASDAEVECSAIPAPAQLTASDNCDLDVDITFTEEVLPGECPYSIVRTWTATDNCGNSVSTTQTLTVVDTEAPILIGVPQDATVECDAIPGVDQVVATDNCDEDLEVTFDDEIVAGDECGYSIIRTWTVTDNCGNTASASQTLTVTDTTDPVVISSLEDLSIECDEEAPLVAPEFDDNCDLDLEVGFAQTIIPGECEHSFTIVRTWTASDDCGNTTSVSQNITVTDTTAPVLVGVPEDVTAECTDIPQAATVTATDNCDSNVMVVLEESLEPLECGFIVTRTWTATDDCGNTTSASQVITAIDETDPIAISVPQDITIECDEVVPDAMPMFEDNCDDDLEITAASSISILDCGELIERSWTATDDCGNSVTVSQTITVVDTTAPVFTDVPQDATVECDAVPAPAEVTAEDNCDDNLIILFEENIVEEGCPYVIERTWTVFDNCDNSSNYTQTITVVDTTDPILIGVPEDATVECDAVPAAATVTADDNCADNLEVFFVEGVEMLDCGFILTRTWSATDECGNTASATQVLTVVDTTAPVLIGVPENVTAECDAVPAPAVVSAEDNCDQQLEVTLTEEEEMQDCGYLLIRTWSVSDDCGNTAAATQVITVVDTTAPIILNAPEDVTVQCDEVPGTGNIEVTDNCDPLVEVNVTEMTEDIECGFILTRTFTATDDCGNAATHIQTITVQDTEAPVVLGVPADVTIECGEPVPAPGQVDVEDNCDPMPMVTTSEETIDLDCGFQIVRTYLATDECGNVGTAQQVITVTDTTPPVFEGQPEDATVNCEELGMAPTLTATDNCDDNVEVTFEEIIGDGCPYTVERIWTATDDCGNTATVTQTLTVIDEEAPVFDDYEFSISMSCEEVDDFLLTATDNCDLDVEVTVVEELTFSGGCLGVLARTYQAVDNCGNVTEVEQLIQVFDDVAPVVFNAPEDLELMCGDEIPAPANDVFATDNCDAEVEIEFTEEQTSEFCPYEIIRTWTAVDECFNTTTVTQVITVDVIVDEFNVSVVTYPNPMDERFTVEFTVPFDSDVVGGVYDMTGREVLPVFQGRADARRLYQLQYGNLNWEAGTYILMLTVDDEVYYHKIVVTQR